VTEEPPDATVADDVEVESAFTELGLTVEEVDGDMVGVVDVLPTMWTPGTRSLRASVAASVADAVLGFHAIRALAPRLPVTLELDVHLFDEIADVPRVHGRSRVVKAGQSVIVTSMDFRDDDGRLVGLGSGSFMAIPNPEFTAPLIDDVLARFGSPLGHLDVPLAERIACVRTEPGTAVLPCAPIVHNASKAINGGMLCVAVEEAALSGDPAATRIETLHVRFVRAIRVGPAVATADVHRGIARVEVRDASSGAVAAIATTHSAGAAP
jgi:acyl-coenzyme A thioesterase PaaI-like protein